MNTTEKDLNQYHLNSEGVREWLPHRYPFLLVDRILEVHPVGDLSNPALTSDKAGTRVVGIKNVSANEPVFQGHFPGFAIFPGVMIIECMAQVAAFSMYPYSGQDFDRMRRDFQCILVGVNSARFRRPVLPGDTMRVEITVQKVRGKLWIFEGLVTVDGVKVAEAEFMANLEYKGASA